VADPREPHAEHDPLVVAALLDRDLVGEERAIAESLIASCPACAALHADLLALSVATHAHPTPSRPRAFTLTTADAARLAAEASGEPGSATPRLSGVMTDPFTPSDHASHDTMLVASLADHSLPASERSAAEALVAACSQCADLHADLLALRAATRAMPTPARPNDYTLTPRDAHRLRSGGWRRFVAILGTSRDALSRPLAVGLTTLGLAGLLVANIPSFYMGGATSAPMSTVGSPVGGGAVDTGDGSTIMGAASAAAEVAASGAPVPADLAGSGTHPAAAPAPSAPGFMADQGSQPPDIEGVTNGSSKGQGAGPGRLRDPGAASDLLLAQEVGGVSPLVVLSAAFLITGLGLFLLRWTARRLGGD
jgi:anti-sigma factor RsiW